MVRQYSIRGIASLVFGVLAWCPWVLILINYALPMSPGPPRGHAAEMPSSYAAGVAVLILIPLFLHLVALSVLFATTGLILGIAELKTGNPKSRFPIAGVFLSKCLLVVFAILNLWGLLHMLSAAPLGTTFALLVLVGFNLIGSIVGRRCLSHSIREKVSRIAGLVGWYPLTIFWIVSAPLVGFLVIFYVGIVPYMLYVLLR